MKTLFVHMHHSLSQQQFKQQQQQTHYSNGNCWIHPEEIFVTRLRSGNALLHTGVDIFGVLCMKNQIHYSWVGHSFLTLCVYLWLLTSASLTLTFQLPSLCKWLLLYQPRRKAILKLFMNNWRFTPYNKITISRSHSHEPHLKLET